MYTFEDWVDSKLKHEITHAHTHNKNNNKKHKNQKYTQQKMKKTEPGTQSGKSISSAFISIIFWINYNCTFFFSIFCRKYILLNEIFLAIFHMISRGNNFIKFPMVTRVFLHGSKSCFRGKQEYCLLIWYGELSRSPLLYLYL